MECLSGTHTSTRLQEKQGCRENFFPLCSRVLPATGGRTGSTGLYFSLLVDGSTDKANVDNEAFMIVWCDVNGADEMIHTQTSYFHVGRPSSVNASGLLHSLSIALQEVGITEVDAEHCSKLVGIVSDGAACNIGLKGLVEAKLSWMFWMWCLAHHLELAVKGTAFDNVDDMLLKLHYLHDKSPKNVDSLRISFLT